MFINARRVAWLCWLLCSFLPYVHCQFGSNPFAGSPFPGGFGRDPIGNGFPNREFGGRVPGRLSQGFDSQRNQRIGGNNFRVPQENRQEAESERAQGEPNQGETLEGGDTSTVAPTTAISTPSSPALIASEPPLSPSPPSPPPPAPIADGGGVGLATEAPPPSTTTTRSRFTPAIEQPTTDPTSGQTIQSLPVLPIDSTLTPLTTSSADTLPSEWTSAMPSMTTTTSTSPALNTSAFTTPSQTSTNTLSPASPTNSTAASAALDLAPLSTSTGSTMSASARGGVGVGVAFAIISIAGLTGFILWRRYRNRHHWRKNNQATVGGLGRFFPFNRTRTSKTDAEWEIGDAEKVEILRGASARTVSRSDSSRSMRPSGDMEGRKAEDGSRSGPKPKLQIVKVGMWVPDRPHPALTSNPPLVSPSQFPRPPSGSSGSGGSGGGGGGRKTSSWPLPEGE
ncbi:uncharacterized protein EI97DRAFT_441760 [Westerdykella ornata]|uniref:Mid2 domain-containing protein n=1 Tax=Westerdykella ornata TaxID=318751 RepID=A0A6A6JK69_WESOR|nr:uncharacterized protein EI97DRAFT_441760 [Westerdykella ornata]KAF2276991.1 hypothetical protein EI97DRAFT_441760 [Westerdykella ornata]